MIRIYPTAILIEPMTYIEVKDKGYEYCIATDYITDDINPPKKRLKIVRIDDIEDEYLIQRLFYRYKIYSVYMDRERKYERALIHNREDVFEKAMRKIKICKPDELSNIINPVINMNVESIKEVDGDFLKKLDIQINKPDKLMKYETLIYDIESNFKLTTLYLDAVSLDYVDKVDARFIDINYLYSKHIYKEKYNIDIDYLRDEGVYIFRSLSHYNPSDAYTGYIYEYPMLIHIGRYKLYDKEGNVTGEKLGYDKLSILLDDRLPEIVYEYPETFGFKKINGYLYKPIKTSDAFILYSSIITNLSKDDLLYVKDMIEPIVRKESLDYEGLFMYIYEYVDKFGIDANLSNDDYYRLIKKAYAYAKYVV